MTRPGLDIAVALPDLLDLHADSGNAAVLQARARWEGIDARITPVRSVDDIPDSTDVWIVGDGDDDLLPTALGELLLFDAALADGVAGGQSLLAVGLGLHLLAGTVEHRPGEWRSGAGILAGEAWILPRRASTELVADSPWGPVVGFENHVRGYRPHGDERPWGAVRAGVGNGDGTEGVVIGTVIGTHLHGPVLAHTPELADALLDRALRRRHGIGFAPASPELRAADALADAVRRSAMRSRRR